MDKTPIQVLKESDKRTQSKSYVWLMRSGKDGLEPLLLYQYSQAKNRDNAVELLKGSQSGLYLMVDGFLSAPAHSPPFLNGFFPLF